VIDTSSNKVKAWVALPSFGYGTAVTRDGRWLLVAMQHGQVAAVDLGTLTVARTIDLPGAPQEVVMRPDGKVAYVSCTRAGQVGQVAAIDLAQWKVESLIDAGKGADGLAWAGR
jgi:DNA-binding beta-propeller fold protein YncE